MKSCIPLIFYICLAQITHAQTEKGNFLIGGSASFQASKLNDTNTTSFSFSPNISYFIIDRFAAGITTPLNANSGSASALKSNSTSYALGPTLRYYFLLNEQWAIFPQFDYYYQWSTSHTDFVNSNLPDLDNKTTSSFYRINVGATYFLVRNVGLEGILYYQNSDAYSSAGPGFSTAGPTYGVRFGLQFYLLRKE